MNGAPPPPAAPAAPSPPHAEGPGVPGGRTGRAPTSPPSPSSPRRARRALLASAAVLVVVGVVAAGLSWRWFVRPTVDGPVRADAIVMFGGAGKRFHKAVQLAEEGYADVVVLSDPRERGNPYTAWGFFCRNTPYEGYEPHDYEAICFDPPTHTTRGEARYVAELARERGWKTVNLVTTTEQATRARMLLARCWDGEIHSVTVATDLFRPARILYEWGALARATFERRSC